jgi:hypothetical protein
MRETNAQTDTNNRLIVGSGLIGVVILVVMLVWLRSYFFDTRNAYVEEMVLSVENPKLKELRAREDIELNSYGWMDQETGVVRIPIDRAIELVVSESQGEPGDGR